MLRHRALGTLLTGVLCLAAAWPAQRGTTQVSPRVPREREARRHTDSILQETPAQVRPPRPEWDKARVDADRLLTLVQQIHKQVHAGPNQLPAALADELKQVEKLSKSIRRKLAL
jgi:hypothetical protein